MGFAQPNFKQWRGAANVEPVPKTRDTPEQHKPKPQGGRTAPDTPKNGEIGQPARASKPDLPTVPVRDANYYGKESEKRV